MLLAEMPELDRMTAGEAASLTGLAPVPRDSGAMRSRRMTAGGRRALRPVLFQAALAAACHNLLLKTAAKPLKERGKRTSWSSSPTPDGLSLSRMRS